MMRSPFYLACLLTMVTAAVADDEVVACDLRAVRSCLVNYVSGFVNPSYASYDPIRLHCMLDMALASCVEKYLPYCSGPIMRALGRAVLSYVRFDNRIGVCQWAGSSNLYKRLLYDGKELNKDWEEKITLINTCKVSNGCALKVDMMCLKAFVGRMRKNPNLCANIPFKSTCLKENRDLCEDDILDDILDVFPDEADKVLRVLCKD